MTEPDALARQAVVVSLWDDNPAIEDLLGFDIVVAPVLAALRHPDLDPITVGVHAPWGGGKSTVLNLIEAKADAKWIVVRSSPWEYEDQLDVKGTLIAEVLAEIKGRVKADTDLLAIPFGEGLTDRFYAPTVLDGVNDQMLVAYEETFGPIAPIIGFRTEEEVIVAANDTTYGLAAYFYTRDAARLIRVAEALDFGVIGANDALPSTPQAPFGGMKQSGLGREGGKWGVQEFLETKYVSVGIG